MKTSTSRTTATLTILEGRTLPRVPTREELTGCAAPLPDDVPEELTDLECRHQPSARRDPIMFSVFDRVFVVAGYESLFSNADDVWYRGTREAAWSHTSWLTPPRCHASHHVHHHLPREWIL